MTATLSPAATGAKFCLRDKVAIQQALDRTGMHDSAQLIRSDHCHDTNFEITGVLLLPVLYPIMDLTKDFVSHFS